VDGIADGLFCLNDHLAFGVMDAVRRSRRLQVGRDFSVIGFDDVPMAAWEAYRLTTFRQDPLLFADEMMAMLERRLDGPDAPAARMLLSSTLIERESVRTQD
jgi:DNA-binding LacI/PurR family transcriptional regulator